MHKDKVIQDQVILNKLLILITKHVCPRSGASHNQGGRSSIISNEEVCSGSAKFEREYLSGRRDPYGELGPDRQRACQEAVLYPCQ